MSNQYEQSNNSTPNPNQHHEKPLGHAHHAYGMYEAGNHVKEAYNAGKEGKHLKQAWHIFIAGLLCFFGSPVFLVFGVTAPLTPIAITLGYWAMIGGGVWAIVILIIRGISNLFG